MGGEKCLMSWSCALLTGSPPRGRGKATFSGRCGPGVGITPAWAGKRRGVFSTPRTAGDHPRVGGEKGGGFVCYRCHWGSPPRGRGKGPLYRPRLFQLGITPAWAGKRASVMSYTHYTEDHPRVGGEKFDTPAVSLHRVGSPPRGRGKAACGALAGGVQRITPAWAGKRSWRALSRMRRGDHPRMGGEKQRLYSPGLCPEGSPPHGRGKAPPC